MFCTKEIVVRVLVLFIYSFSLQKRVYFRLRNKETGKFVSTDGNLDNLNLLRIQVAEDTDLEDQIWVYQDGFIRCRVGFNFNVNYLFCSSVAGLTEFNCYYIVLIFLGIPAIELFLSFFFYGVFGCSCLFGMVFVLICIDLWLFQVT